MYFSCQLQVDTTSLFGSIIVNSIDDVALESLSENTVTIEFMANIPPLLLFAMLLTSFTVLLMWQLNLALYRDTPPPAPESLTAAFSLTSNYLLHCH